MKIHGREIGFMLTVDAACKLALLCPDEDLSKISTLLEGTYPTISKNAIEIVRIMNEGYEDAAAYETGCEPFPLTNDELKTISPSELLSLRKEALDVFVGDAKPKVKVKPSKKNKKTR